MEKGFEKKSINAAKSGSDADRDAGVPGRNASRGMKERLLKAVQAGELSMRPRWFFVLRSGLAVGAAIGTGLAVLFIVSFTLFSLRASGVSYVSVFGSAGWREFFLSLPWMLLAVALACIVAVEIVLRKFAFAYRQPLVYTALGILALALFGGMTLAHTPFHRGLLVAAEENRLPVAGRLYRGFGAPRLKNVHPGLIIELTEDGFMLEDRRRDVLRVVADSRTRFPFGTEFAEGDAVLVFGRRDGDVVQAFGIRKIGEALDFPAHAVSGRRFEFRVPWAR